MFEIHAGGRIWSRTGPLPEPEERITNEAFVDACFHGDLQKVQEVIAHEPLTAVDLDEGLSHATECAHHEIVAALFAAGATVSELALDSLPGQDCNQSPIVIRHFFDHGMDPNARQSSGEPLLIFMSNAACAREFLSRGADPNITSPRGVGPLASAIIGADEASTGAELVELLIASGAHLTSDLLFAAARPRVRQGPFMTTLLLSKGLDPNVVSAEWGMPLHQAVRSGKPATVKALLDAGANPTALATGRHIGKNTTPLELAKNIGYGQHKDLCKTITDMLRSYAATWRESAPGGRIVWSSD